MADEPEAAGGPEPFDLQRLRELIELMEKYDVTQVSLRRGDEKWDVRRGAGEFAPAPPPRYPAAAGAPESMPAADAPAAGKAEETGLLIKSPTVGTFYAAPNPDDPPFVTLGTKVQPETIVCIVEAMKVFNQIPAEVSGTIVEILVENGDPVDFGQPLFRVQ